MNKLSFRARALDATKPMPIYMSEELPDLPEYSAINRAVPQMPSGMEKEEECVSFTEFLVACSGSHLELAPYSNFLNFDLDSLQNLTFSGRVSQIFWHL